MLRSLAVTALLIALACPATFAQIPTPPGTPDTQQSDNSLDNLQAAFPHIAWNGKTQGLLLAVQPAEARWWDASKETLQAFAEAWAPQDPLSPDDSDEAAQKPLLLPKGNYGLNASYVARHFRRKFIHVGTVTVFAPQMMILLNHDLKPPNPFAGMSFSDNLIRLEASLTPSQWKLLGSPDGLGSADLTEAQQPVFEAMLPEPGSIYRRTKTTPAADPATEPMETHTDTTLPEGQRKAIRLRIDRTADFALISADDDSSPDPRGIFSDTPAGSESLGFLGSPMSFEQRRSQFGQQIGLRVPNRLKPSDLDLKSAAMDAGVPVANAKTVGDLVRGVKARTGLDLYADVRLSYLPIAIEGGSTIVRAGDLLEALCWALTATYRKVGSLPGNPNDFAYVLTYDREGIAVQRSPIFQWAGRGEKLSQMAITQCEESVEKQKPEQYFSFHSGNLLNPSPEALKEAENPKDPSDIVVPVSELTETQRQQMQDGVKRLQKEYDALPAEDKGDGEGKRSPPHFRSDRVRIQLANRFVYVLPGVGEVNVWEDSYSESSFNNTQSDADDIAATRPVPGKRIFLVIRAPRSDKEAEALLSLAAGRGIHQVWIQANGTTPTMLAACVAAGKAHRLPIGIVFDLMRAPSGSLPPNRQNVNVFGQTGTMLAAEIARLVKEFASSDSELEKMPSLTDVRNPALPETLAELTALVLPLSRTPGLNAIIFNEAAAPGYEWQSRTDTGGSFGRDFGYTLQNRLAFLRREGCDPIDFDPVGQMPISESISLPFFDIGQGMSADEPGARFGDAIQSWNNLRTRQQTHLLETLRANLDNANPGLSFYLSEKGDDDYRLWRKSEALVLIVPNDSDSRNKTTIPRYRHQHSEYLRALSAHEYPEHTSEAGAIASQLHTQLGLAPYDTGQSSEFAVLDLTSMPVHDALPLIAGALLPAK